MDPLRALRAAVAEALDHPLAAPVSLWLVACSGGPDSTALVDALEALAPARGLTLHVASVDHGLRPEAANEAATVVSACVQRGLAATVLRAQVDGRSMAAARRARYDVLVAEARRTGAGGIAVAHTATDQAETMLDRLLRGAGTGGLAAMAPARRIDGDLALVRPLLTVPRHEVEAYVQARGLAVVRDPTNENPKYRRTRLRHEVLPLLRRERPDLDRALAETCVRLRADAEALEAAAAASAQRLRGDDGSFDAAGLAALPEALFARVVTAASGAPLGAVHIRALTHLCSDRRGTRSLDLPCGLTAERRYDRLWLGPRTKIRAPIDTGEVAVPSPGIYLLGVMEVEVSVALYAALGDQPMTLRHVRPGDRVRHGKLQDLLVNAKVPRPERARLPVLARGREVLWVQGLPLTGRGAVQ